MRSKLQRFPEVVKADINRQKGRAYLWAKPSFYAYVALQHSLEEAGGAIQMVHPEYEVPHAYYAVLGVRDKDPDKILALQDRLGKVKGVRVAIVDEDRWFKNDRGLDVGGAVIFADRTPTLDLDLIDAAKSAGFVYEPNVHGHGGNDDDKWSMTNHAFAGLCLLSLTVIGLLQMNVKRPVWYLKYGTVLVWSALFVFLFIRSDRDGWPLGPISWWDGFRQWDTLGHRIGMLLIILLAIGDYLRIRGKFHVNPAVSRWGMLTLGLAGSTMLYTHLHTSLDPVHYQMVRWMNAEHMAMATWALLFSVSKFSWDTWKIPHKSGQYLWLVFLALLGVTLALYVE